MDQQPNIAVLDKGLCLQSAKELFLLESGLNQEGAKFERMRRDAFGMLDRLERSIDLKAVYRVYDDIALEGKLLRVDGLEITCAAFEQILPESVEAVIIYALTAGSYELVGADFFDQCYADLWGTALAESAFAGWQEELSKLHALSECFGPGYYRMDVAELAKIAALVNISSIGLRVTDSYVILPQKSCMGLFFKVNHLYKPLAPACMLCSGNKKSCRLCIATRKLTS